MAGLLTTSPSRDVIGCDELIENEVILLRAADPFFFFLALFFLEGAANPEAKLHLYLAFAHLLVPTTALVKAIAAVD